MNETTDDLSRRQRAKLKEQQRDVQLALTHPATRRLLRRVIDISGVFNPNGDEGERRVGLWIIAEINNADPHAFAKLLHDAANEKIGADHAD